MHRSRLLVLLPALLAVSACVPLPAPAPPPRSTVPAPAAIVPATEASTTTAQDLGVRCDPERPTFILGFGKLKEQLGDKMGAAVGCEEVNHPTGDTRQMTSSGIAYWRQFPNEPAFTNGWDHWALTESGLRHWTAEVVDSPSTAPGVVPCPAGQSPEFTHGFAALKSQLGDRMGEPSTCVRYLPSQDAMQRTTTGLAWYRHATNTPTFMSGSLHWALTAPGLVQWEGESVEPPADAGLVEDPGDLLPPQTTALSYAPAEVVESIPNLPRPVEGRTLRTDQHPAWLEEPLHLLWGYDKVTGSVLVPMIRSLPVAVGPLLADTGAVGMYVPREGMIVLDQSLARETPEVVAAVLAHEATHAIDVARQPRPSQAACYTLEVSAFATEARVWERLYGPNGKPDPRTALEEQQNEVLRHARTSPGELIRNVKHGYEGQCEDYLP